VLKKVYSKENKSCFELTGLYFVLFEEAGFVLISVYSGKNADKFRLFYKKFNPAFSLQPSFLVNGQVLKEVYRLV